MSLNAYRQMDKRFADLSDDEIRYVLKNKDNRFAGLSNAEIDYVASKGVVPSFIQVTDSEPKSITREQAVSNFRNHIGVQTDQQLAEQSGDFRNLLNAGIVNAFGNITNKAADWTGSETLKSASDALYSRGDVFSGALSPEQKAANEKIYLHDDLTFGDAWTDSKAWKNIAASAGSSLLTSMATGVTRIGMMLNEALQIGGGVYKEIEDAVLDLDNEVIEKSPGYQELLAKSNDTETAKKEFAQTLASEYSDYAVPVGAALSWFGDKYLVDALTAKLEGSIGKRLAVVGGTQAVSEGLQGASEQTFVNAGVIEAGDDRGYFDGVPNAAVQEGLAGAMMAPIGGLGSPDREESKDNAASVLNTELMQPRKIENPRDSLDAVQNQIIDDRNTIDQLAKKSENLMAGMGLDPNGQLSDQDIVNQNWVLNEDGTMDIAPLQDQPAPQAAVEPKLMQPTYGAQIGQTSDYGQIPQDYGYPLTIPQTNQQTNEVVTAKPAQDKIEQQAAGGLAVLELPVANLKLSEDVPQFKDGANDKGVIDPLGGKFNRVGVSPIQVWERLDGSLEVISGRHRLDLAQRSGEETIPAQIHREADGFSATQAAILDAELNIRDNQGSVKDYVNYFRETRVTQEEAELQGLLRGSSTGARAYRIATNGTEEVIAAHRAGVISDEGATRIVEAAPGDARLQLIGLELVNKGSSYSKAANVMRAVASTTPQGPQAENLDLFGQDDSYMQDVVKMANLAAKHQRAIQAEVLAARNAANNPEAAKKSGVEVKDAQATKQRLTKLEEEKQAWSEWHKHPSLVSQLQQEAGIATQPSVQPEEALLQPYTQQDLEQQANQQSMFEQAEAQAIQQDQIQSTADNFTLAGSDTYLDQAAAAGQSDMLGMFDQGEANATPQPTPKATQETETQASEVSQSPVIEKPEETIERIAGLIKQRTQKDYSEMIANQSDLALLTDAERAELHAAKQALPSRAEEAVAAKERIKARREEKALSRNSATSEQQKPVPIKPGATYRTESGAETTPFPNRDTEKEVNQWLIDNMVMEAERTSNDMLATAWRNEKADNLPPASKDEANLILFGDELGRIDDRVASQPIKLSKSGKPFATEKTARLSQTFKETPNAEIVPVDGGFGVREGSKPVVSKMETVEPKPNQETKPKQNNNLTDATVTNEDTKSKPDQESEMNDAYSDLVEPNEPMFARRANKEEDDGVKNLYVAHNLTADNLIHADKMGGLPVPSLAVARSDIGFDSFGDISLISEPDILDDKFAKTFNADIYSPRYPSVSYDVDYKAFNDLLEDYNAKLGDYGIRKTDPSEVESRGLRAIKDSFAVKLAFLDSKGRLPKVKKEDYTTGNTLPETWMGYVNKGFTEDSLANDPGFNEYFETVKGDAFKNDEMKNAAFLRIVGAIVNYNPPKTMKRIAGHENQKEINRLVSLKTLANDFDNFAQDVESKIIKSERIFNGFSNSGNRRYLPHNLDQVVKLLKKELQGGEGMNYGIGTVRSGAAKQFKSIAQIKKDRDSIIASDDMALVKEEVSSEFDGLVEALRPYYKYDQDGFRYMDSASEGLYEMARGKGLQDFEGVPNDLMLDVREFLTKLKNIPTEYFESKVQRAVGLSEFKYAVMPKGVPDRVKQIARDNGLKIKYYDSKEDGDRARVINGLNDVLFSFAGKNAATADKVRLSNAERMLKEGVDAETVRKETGWFKGIDGEWRFEIDDSKAKVKIKERNDSFNRIKASANGRRFRNIPEWKEHVAKYSTLDGILDHAELYKSYPALMGVKVVFNEDSANLGGSYSPSDNTITIDGQLTDAEVKSVLLHEVQHAIQTAENFASGGNPEQFETFSENFARDTGKARMDRARKDMDEVMAEVFKQNPRLEQRQWELDNGEGDAESLSSEDYSKAYRDLTAQIDAAVKQVIADDFGLRLKYDAAQKILSGQPIKSAYEQYRALAGEVESRNVETRMTMDAAERLLRSPESTEDTPRSVQTVSKGRGNMASQTQESVNESIEITNLKTDLGRFYGVEPSQVEARADELLLPDDVRSTLEELYGRKIIGFKGGEYASAFNGVVLPGRNDAIYVASDSSKPIMNIAGHEFLHALKQDNEELYYDLVAEMQPLIINNFEYGEKLNEARRAEGKGDASFDLIIEEIIADVMGDNFTQPEFWAKVSQQLDAKKPGLFNKLIQRVKAFLKDLHAAINPLGHDKYVNDVEAAQNAVAKASALHLKSRMGNKGAKAELDKLAGDLVFSRRDPKETNPQENTPPTDKEGRELLAQWGNLQKNQQRFYDRFIRVQQIQEAIQKKAEGKVPDMYGAIQRYLAITPSKIEDFSTDVESLIEQQVKQGITSDAMGLYLYAKHAPERNAYLKESRDVDDGSGMSDDQASTLVNELKEEFPSIEKFAKQWRTMIDKQLDERVDAGTISAEARDNWREIYPNYVPLKNKVDMGDNANDLGDEIYVEPMDGFMGTGQRFNLTGAEVKRAKGRSSMAGDIIGNVVYDMQRGIVRAEKNRVNRLLHFAMKAYPQKSLWEASPDTKTGLNEVSYFKDGKKVNVVIKDAALLEAWKGLEQEPFTLVDKTITFIKRTITAWNPAFTIINSIRDTQMALVNGSQELGARGAARMASYVKGATAASYRYERKKKTDDDNLAGKEWDKWHKLYRLSGGKTGYMDIDNLAKTQAKIDAIFERDQRNSLKGIKSKTAQSLYKYSFGLFEDVGSATENMWRLAAFRVAMEQGKGPQEAAKIAKNLTVNFDRKGADARKLDRLFLFYNPAMQGLARMKQTLSSPRRVLAVVGGLMALGFMAGMQGEEDDEGNNVFDLLPEHEKMRSIPIIIGGVRLNIPMSYGLGQFTYMGMKMAQMVRFYNSNGRNGVDAKDAVKGMAHGLALHFNPFGGMQFSEGVSGEEDQLLQLLSPVLLDPFVQVLTNKSGFGTSLYPENPYNPDDTVDSEKVFDYKRDSLFYDVAKGMSRISGGDGVQPGLVEVTPATLETFVRTLTGGAGRFVEQTVRLPFNDYEEGFEPSKIPVMSSVLKKGNDRVYYNAYSDIRNDVDAFKREYKKYAELGVESKLDEMDKDYRQNLVKDNDDIKKELREYSVMLKLIRKELESETDEEKQKGLRAEIREYQAQQNALRAEMVAIYGQERQRYRESQ